LSARLTDTDFSKLTDLQRRFAQEYAIDWNGTRAYKDAGYKVKTDAAAASGASRLLRNGKIKAYLDHLRNNIAEAAGISALWIAQHYKAQVEAGIDHIMTDWFSREEYADLPAHVKACIKKVETKRDSYDREGKEVYTEWVKVEFYDKQTALKALRDMIGADAPIRSQHEHSSPGGQPLTFTVQVSSATPPVTSEDEIDDGIAP
jgi:hypothetical protein